VATGRHNKAARVAAGGITTTGKKETYGVQRPPERPRPSFVHRLPSQPLNYPSLSHGVKPASSYNTTICEDSRGAAGRPNRCRSVLGPFDSANRSKYWRNILSIPIDSARRGCKIALQYADATPPRGPGAKRAQT